MKWNIVRLIILQMGFRHAHHSSHHQLLECLKIRHSLLLRYLWVLRRFHLLTKRHPSSYSSRRRRFLSLHCRCLARSDGRVSLRINRREPLFPALRPSIHQGLRHSSYYHLLYGVYSHWKDGKCELGSATYQPSILSHYRKRMVRTFLGCQNSGCVHCYPIRNSTHHFVLV